MAAKQSNRWFPSQTQLTGPEATERSFRQLLDQHYALQDQVNAMGATPAKPASAAASTGPPPGSGPADTQLLGMRVQPIDTQTLADGATLKWNKKSGTFIVS